MSQGRVYLEGMDPNITDCNEKFWSGALFDWVSAAELAVPAPTADGVATCWAVHSIVSSFCSAADML